MNQPDGDVAWHIAGSQRKQQHPMAPSVLVVDDNDDIRAVVAVFVQADPRFELAGEACDGPTAIDLARQHCPDAVVLDVNMPGMDGIETLVHLRALCPGATIIMYTTESGRAEDAGDLGAERWFTKDTPVTDLLDTLHQLVTDR